MKALILAGGRGSRLKPLTYSTSKQLLKIANKPTIFYGIESLIESGVDNFGIIISPETGNQIKEVVGNGSRWNVNITYIIQDEPAGLAHAVLTAESFIDNSPFVMYLGDNIIGDKLNLNICRSTQVFLKKVDNPIFFGVAELDNNGKIVSLEEKPKQPKSNLALVGVYVFTPAIFKACKSIRYSSRGELEITDAIQWLISHNYPVYSNKIASFWLDTGKRDDLLKANQTILRYGTHDQQGKDTLIQDSHISRLSIIGDNCKIINSLIGTYCAIDDNSIVNNSVIDNTIIGKNCTIENVTTGIQDSIIGSDVIIRKSLRTNPSKIFIGSNSEFIYS